MSLLGMILGMGQGAGNAMGTSPPSPLLDLIQPQKRFNMEPQGVPSMQGGIPDAGSGQGFIDPYEKRAPAIGSDFHGGGMRVPQVATPPAPDNPFEYTPKTHDEQAFSPLTNIAYKTALTPQQQALQEQGFAPDSVQANAFAGLKQPAGAKSTTTPKASTPKAQNAPTPVPEVAHTPNNELRRQSISRIESGSADGNYRALGVKTRTGDRAYGRYQVMGNNIGPWTQQVLGRRLTPQEFLANPVAQDKVFDEIFGEAVQRYGEAGAASVWFTGSPTPSGKKDPGGTVDHDYVARYMHGLNMPMSAVGNQRPGTGDASVMEAMQPGVSSAISGATGGDEQMMAKNTGVPDQQQAQNGAQPEQQAPTPEQMEQVRQMSLKERLALLQQFMQLGGFKPGEGSIG